MKQDQNLRFVIIGMGYLMEYIAPCYSKLLGDKKAEQMLGVTAEPQAVQTVQQRKPHGRALLALTSSATIPHVPAISAGTYFFAK